MKTVQIRLPSLNADVVGEEDHVAGFAFFRGIPYASYAKRWTQSQTLHSLDSVFDATKLGPRCPQSEDSILVSGGVNDPIPGDDEFHCLNLNITVPKEALARDRSRQRPPLLPVMFWIHGGAFKTGANSVARYRPQELSLIAKQASQPIVLVQINYRLGALGFAASKDLAREFDSTLSTLFSNASSDTSSAFLGNYGFVDQRNALEWVRNHISDFGGDPSNVTAFGISAGSASLHHHILTESPQFDRAILMSGSAPTMGPRPLEYFQKGWDNLCKSSGVLNESYEKRLETLRSLAPSDLIRNYGSASIGPLADGKLLPKSWCLGQQHRPTRCKAVIIGDTRVEAIILDRLSRDISQKRFQQLVRTAFAEPADAVLFCKYFGFTSEDMPYEKYRDAMRVFLSVVIFHFPNLKIAETYDEAGKIYLYHFEEPSPYVGPTLGLPYHGQCALFMYNNEKDSHPEPARRISLELANIWTAFAYGKEPWEPYPVAKRFMRFGPRGESTLMSMESDDMRDYGYLNWLRNHFEEAKNLVHSLR